jgi:hypothetical protein
MFLENSCMMRGPRSPVIMPRAELTWSPVDGLNCAVLLTLDHCGWLNVLYVSVRNATSTRSLTRKFFVGHYVYRVPGGRLNCPQIAFTRAGSGLWA